MLMKIAGVGGRELKQCVGTGDGLARIRIILGCRSGSGCFV